MFELTRNKYFNALPSWIQESILQSAVKFENEDSLRKFAENLENPED